MRSSITSLWLSAAVIACTPKQETVKPEIKTVTEAVYASGTLTTEKEYKVVSAIDGYLTDVLVTEGNSIKAGELLFSVKNNTRSAQEQSAAAMLEKTLPVVNDHAPVFRERNWFVVYHQRPKNDLPKVKNALFIANEIEKLQGVEGVAPQVSTQAFFNNGPIKISGSIAGIDVEKQKTLFNLENKMEEGSLEDLLKTNHAFVLGKGLAKKANIFAGDRVSITTPEGANLILRVVGIFSFGIGSFDETKSYASIATVQKVLQRDPSYITELHIKLKDYTEAKATGKEIASTFNAYTEDWETANASLLAGDKIRNAMTGIISFTLLLVAGFGIYNIMNMNIMNKMKDIAILKATGFGGKDIIAIFLSQSVIIGTIGGVLGVAVGYACCLALDVTPFPEGDFFRMKTMPVDFNPKFYMLGLWFGIITTLFAGYFPAKKASGIDPVQILRG